MLKLCVSVAILCSIASSEGNFVENAPLWDRIDDLNARLEGDGNLSSEELEALFRTAVDIAAHSELAQQIEDLRTDAFITGDFTVMDEYSGRAEPAIEVFSMGESTSLGVGVFAFLLKSRPGTGSYAFFDLASDGFYLDGELRIIGTAELPEWMDRSGSSHQAVIDREAARQYLGIWKSLLPEFHGYFRTIAFHTIAGLNDDALILSGEELQSYTRVYDDPFVQHVRAALDSFIAGERRGIFEGQELMESLESWREYLPHRFVVLALEPSPAGGYLITLLSREKSDRVFSAWVYRLAPGDYQLRGFGENTDIPRDEIPELILRYSAYLADTVHCI